MAGFVLAIAALAELAGRLSAQPGEAARLGVVAHGVVSVPTAALLVVLSLLATMPLALPLAPPGPAVAVVLSWAACLALPAAFAMTSVTGAVALLAAGYRAGRAGAATLVAGLGLPFAILALAGHGQARAGAVALAFGLPAAATAGLARRARVGARLLGAERAASAGSAAEHTARGERARIARELHDVVAHHISMIAVQAETARLTTAGMPAAGAKRLTEIADTARAGLTEMRRLLGVLREDAAPGEPAARSPQPGLAELNALVDAARGAAGGSVRLIVSGPVARLDPGVELAAFRIVQEGLTNARRHAPGAAVDVELRYGKEMLRLRVRDNGPGIASRTDMSHRPGSAGHGLVGMRERAQAAGGSLTTRQASGGGFLVEALLPVPAATS